MAVSLADPSRSLLIVIDMQPSFLAAIHEADRVTRRVEFLMRIANLLGVQVVATEQYPERMGASDERLAGHFRGAAIGKMTFSCVGCKAFDDVLSTFEASRDRAGQGVQAVIVGIETHICVTQTALQLLQQGYDVKVCEDAVGARAVAMNDIGFRRLRHAGADVAHTESIAYEWLHSADNPLFRDALKIVKEFA